MGIALFKLNLFLSVIFIPYFSQHGDRQRRDTKSYGKGAYLLRRLFSDHFGIWSTMKFHTCVSHTASAVFF